MSDDDEEYSHEFDHTAKFRGFCFTWNNYTDENIQAVLKLKTEYLVYGKEFSKTPTKKWPIGTPHLQGYLYFKNPVYWSSVRKKIHGAHLEAQYPNSTPTQASDYCKKEAEEIFERGTCPEQGKRNDVLIVREALKDGLGMRGVVKVATNLASIKIAEAILKYEEPKRNWKPKITWYWGLTGTGKSKKAHEAFEGKDYYRKSSTTEKWFDGYDAHEFVIFDDFLFPENKKEYNYWLDLFDRYSCVVQTKGGIRQFLAKEIIVTSSRHPFIALQDFHQGGGEFLRRIDEIIEFK